MRRREERFVWVLRALIIAVPLVSGGWWGYARYVDQVTADGEAAAAQVVERYPYVRDLLEVRDGTTYGILMEEAGVGGSEANAIFAAAEPVYDLSRVRLGRTIELVYARDTHELRGLDYQIDSEEILHVTRSDNEASGWEAVREDIPYETVEREASGTVESSLYEAGLGIGLDERAIIALAETFQWTLDFAMDVRVGDTFAFIYEGRYLDGKYVMPGAVRAAKYVNDGHENYAFRFETSEGEVGYYDETGDSVQKVFLKAPVAFKYITSGYTTGLRYVSAFSTATRHRAIDYAAPAGTPIRAVGDGTVVFAGWSSAGYGNLTSIRHNGVYTTNYAHQSRILVHVGQKVTQGQTIGYVGSTGFSTGPHLHYEMVKYGQKINPLIEEFPSTGPVPEVDMQRFLDGIAGVKAQLDAIRN